MATENVHVMDFPTFQRVTHVRMSHDWFFHIAIRFSVSTSGTGSLNLSALCCRN